MATSSPVVPVSASVEPIKLPVVSLMVAVVVGIVVSTAGVSGFVYLLARSGHLPMPAVTAAKTEPVGPSATRALVLDSLLVNLADNGGSAFHPRLVVSV